MRIRPSPAAIEEIAFFAAFLGCVQAGIDTRLIYHWQTPVFYRTLQFLGEFLEVAGGPVEYLYALAAQTFRWPWWGAFVLAVQAAAVTRLTHICIRPLGPLRFLPALVLLFTANLYSHRTPIAFQLLVGLGAGAVCARLAGRWVAAVPAVMGAAFYLGGPAVVFCAPVAAMALWRKRRIAAAAVLLFGAALALSTISARSWFTGADTRVWSARWTLVLFYSLAPTLVIRPRRAIWTGVARAVTVVSLAAVAFASHRLNARDRRLAALDFFTLHEDWAAVLQVGESLASGDFNSLARYEINLALYESGRFGDEMFRFPQSGSPLLNLRPNAFLPYAIRQADLCLRLGRVNDAERFGSEARILGDRDPRVYRLMAEVNLVKGETAAAARFSRALDASPGWPTVVSNARIETLRRRMLRTDDTLLVWQRAGHPEGDIERMLLDQLEQDPSNRMAFEFLMGQRLTARDLVGVAALMPRIKDMPYARHTPRHYQEAMAMYADMTGKPPAIEGLSIESETLNRIAVFKRIVAQGPTREAAMQAAWPAFRHTYFFYYVFGPGDYR